MAIPWIVAHGEVTISGVKTDTKSPFHRRSRKDTPPTRSSKKLEFPTNCNDFIVDQRPSERWFPCGHGSANAESRTPGIGSTRIPLNRPGFPGAVHFGSVPFSPSPLRHRSIVLRQHHPPAFRLAASLRSVPNRPPQGLTSSPSPAPSSRNPPFLPSQAHFNFCASRFAAGLSAPIPLASARCVLRLPKAPPASHPGPPLGLIAENNRRPPYRHRLVPRPDPAPVHRDRPPPPRSPAPDGPTARAPARGHGHR